MITFLVGVICEGLIEFISCRDRSTWRDISPSQFLNIIWYVRLDQVIYELQRIEAKNTVFWPIRFCQFLRIHLFSAFFLQIGCFWFTWQFLGLIFHYKFIKSHSDVDSLLSEIKKQSFLFILASFSYTYSFLSDKALSLETNGILNLAL